MVQWEKNPFSTSQISLFLALRWDFSDGDLRTEIREKCEALERVIILKAIFKPDNSGQTSLLRSEKRESTQQNDEDGKIWLKH